MTEQLQAGERRVLIDAAELSRERSSGKIDKAYSMAASFDDFKSLRPGLITRGLMAEDGAITDAGREALAVVTDKAKVSHMALTSAARDYAESKCRD